MISSALCSIVQYCAVLCSLLLDKAEINMISSALCSIVFCSSLDSVVELYINTLRCMCVAV